MMQINLYLKSSGLKEAEQTISIYKLKIIGIKLNERILVGGRSLLISLLFHILPQ